MFAVFHTNLNGFGFHTMSKIKQKEKDLTVSQQKVWDLMDADSVRLFFKESWEKGKKAPPQVTCIYCDKPLQTSGGTSNPKGHLVRKHDDRVLPVLQAAGAGANNQNKTVGSDIRKSPFSNRIAVNKMTFTSRMLYLKK